VKSNAPVQLGGSAAWTPRLSQSGPQQLIASSTSTRWQTIIPTLIAGLAALALIVVLALRRRRHVVD
jgi:MYXO-CTERM domain-containing protein